MKIIEKIRKKLKKEINCKFCGTVGCWMCRECMTFMNGAEYFSDIASKGYIDANLNLIRDKINLAKAWDVITPEEFILARNKWLRKHERWLMDVKNQAEERVKTKKKISRAFYEGYMKETH